MVWLRKRRFCNVLHLIQTVWVSIYCVFSTYAQCVYTYHGHIKEISYVYIFHIYFYTIFPYMLSSCICACYLSLVGNIASKAYMKKHPRWPLANNIKHTHHRIAPIYPPTFDIKLLCCSSDILFFIHATMRTYREGIGSPGDKA